MNNLRYLSVLAAAALYSHAHATCSDDFDPGIDLSQWSGFGGVVGGTVLGTNYGGYVSSPNSLWFGDSGTRYAMTLPLDTTSGGTIDFSIRLANGVSPTWETVDALPAEGVVLEHSVNGGSSWTVMGTYDTTNFYAWTTVAVLIPSSAQATNAIFRWRQLSHSGIGFDHWALDDVMMRGPRPPTITTQPVSQTISAGSTASLIVIASGSSPLSYQWRKGGMVIAGATASAFTLANVQSTDAGVYSVFVSNAFGVVASSNATLSVFYPSVPDTLNPRASDHVYSIAVQADGKILVGGSFTLLGGQSRIRIARLNADGSLDSNFNLGANGSVYTVLTTRSWDWDEGKRG